MTTTTSNGLAIHEQNLEKQIEKHMGGCMSGFFNIFDRSHRLYPKRLPPPPHQAIDSSSSEIPSSAGSPALSREFDKPKIVQYHPPDVKSSPMPPTPPPKSPSPVGVTSNFDIKEAVKTSPWKFTREAPRLSLDSRAITDGKGGLRPREIRVNTRSNSATSTDEERRSPSVIARLMGLEPTPSSAVSETEPEKKVELRRSASESRSRDYRFSDTPSFLSPVATSKNEFIKERKMDSQHQLQKIKKNGSNINLINGVRSHDNSINNVKTRNQQHQNNQRRLMVERRSYYDTADFFPQEVPVKQQQHQAVTIYGEIERRLRMRGIDEPSKDLETLKHILEALQLKGLLHSSTSGTTATNAAAVKSRQNVDRRLFGEDDSPIVLMRPSRPTSPTPVGRRRGNVSSSGEPSVSPRRERQARSPMRSPGRAENRTTSPVVRRRGGPLSVETQRRGNETTTVRGAHSPVQSPRMTRRSDQTVNRSPRSRRSTAESRQEDEVSTVSESSFSTSSHTDNERWRVEEYRDGKYLLDRCDKLLHSIAEMNSSSNSNSAELQQPSPVSVLDSSFYKEDESSPSPVKKRTIDFKDQAVIELDDDVWSPSSSTQLFKLDYDIDSSDDSDFSYVSEVLRASHYLPDENNLFMLLEKQCSIRGISRDKSKASILQRKLIFDTISEILDRNRQLPPWMAASSPSKPMLSQIWTEFQKIKERGPSEDLFEVICGVLKKDLAGDSINGWSDCPVEMSEAVLDIERLIFKDLIGETIRDLASFAGKSDVQAPRRKLVF